MCMVCGEGRGGKGEGTATVSLHGGQFLLDLKNTWSSHSIACTHEEGTHSLHCHILAVLLCELQCLCLPEGQWGAHTVVRSPGRGHRLLTPVYTGKGSSAGCQCKHSPSQHTHTQSRTHQRTPSNYISVPHTQVAGTPVHAQVDSSSFDAVWHASPYSSRALSHNLNCTIVVQQEVWGWSTGLTLVQTSGQL